MSTTEINFEKSRAILTARLPELANAGLNFEKRTGNFFKSTIDTETDKVRRLTVSDEQLPTDDAAVKEIAAKRAAATVLNADERRERLFAQLKKLEAQVDDVRCEINTLEEDVATAIEVCKAFALPEKAGRSTLSAKIESVTNENEKLRQLLIAAGIDPDQQ